MRAAKIKKEITKNYLRFLNAINKAIEMDEYIYHVLEDGEMESLDELENGVVMLFQQFNNNWNKAERTFKNFKPGY